MILPVVIAVLIFCVGVSSADQDSEILSRAQLISHSIETPYSKNLLDDWILAGGVMGAFEHVIVVPGITEVKGQLWNRKPLLTNSFDVEFTMEISTGPGVASVNGNPIARSRGMALWYLEALPDGLTASTHHLEDVPLLGMKQSFKGLGVFFSIFDRENKINHSVSAAVSDGTKIWKPVGDIPTNGGVYWRIRDVGPLQVVISVSPGQISGKARTIGNPKWTSLFAISGTVPAGGFLGFSGDSGGRGPPGSPDERLSDRIIIKDVRVFNKDLSLPGEERSDNVQSIVQDLNSLPSKADHTEQLKELSHVLTKLVVEILPRQDDISQTLNVMDSRLNRLSSDVAYVLSRVDKVQNKVNEGASIDAVQYQSVLKELHDLKELFQSHAEVAQSIIEVKNAVESHRPVNKRQLESINNALTAQAKTGWVMFIVLIVVVIAVVVFVWKKSRDLEKKHLF